MSFQVGQRVTYVGGYVDDGGERRWADRLVGRSGRVISLRPQLTRTRLADVHVLFEGGEEWTTYPENLRLEEKVEERGEALLLWPKESKFATTISAKGLLIVGAEGHLWTESFLASLGIKVVPIPEEPPVGSVFRTKSAGTDFRRYEGTASTPSYWSQGASSGYRTWESLCQTGGKVIYNAGNDA